MSKVGFKDFSSSFAEELNIDRALDPTTQLKDLSEFDSAGKIYISLIIEEQFGFQIEHRILNECESLKDLYDYCCKQ